MTDRKKCTGCSACVAACPCAAITMRTDDEGFLYPVIDEEKCRACGICDAVCPVDRDVQCSQDPKRAFIIFSQDEALRSSSSSGGLFSLLADIVFKNGGVVFGCRMSEDCYSAKHTAIAEENQMWMIRGSKYVQSAAEDTFLQAKRMLEAGRWVLYSGTPCQIAGFRSYLGDRHYDRLLTVDVICHGVPSPMVWRKYAAELESVQNSKITKVFFRDKTEGWQKYSLRCEFENGAEYRKSVVDDLYLRGFIENLYLRPSCYHCSIKAERYHSDLTIGDCWSKAVRNAETANIEGISMAVVHTPQGMRMLQKMPACYIREVNMDAVLQSNRSYYYPVNNNLYRKQVIQKIRKKGVHKTLRNYCGSSISAKLRRKIAALLKESC